MKCAVSNIAWAPDDRHKAYGMLARAGFTGLEIAPPLFFASTDTPFEPSSERLTHTLREVAEHGLSLVSMQSLLFNVSGAALFEGPEPLALLEAGMRRAITLAGLLGIPNLVFGSPRQRVVPDGMAMEQAEALAVDVFRRLGEAARAAGTVIAVEPNAAAYGTNFLNELGQAEAFVKRVDHDAITLILDLGAVHMNHQFDRIDGLIAQTVPSLSHVHISEPQLAPAPADTDQAVRVLRALKSAGYKHWTSIEMKADPSGLQPLQAAIDRLRAAVSLVEEGATQ